MPTPPDASDHRPVTISDPRSSGDSQAAPAWPVSQTVDHVLTCYIKWHEDAANVRDTYGRWSASAPDANDTGLFSAYLAALDQEEASAGNYALGMARLDALVASSGMS